MPGNLEISLELLLLLWQPGLTEVRLLYVDYLVSVALNDIPENRYKESCQPVDLELFRGHKIKG